MDTSIILLLLSSLANLKKIMPRLKTISTKKTTKAGHLYCPDLRDVYIYTTQDGGELSRKNDGIIFSCLFKV